jgi:hypothetical protein
MKNLFIMLLCFLTIVQAQFKRPELSSKYASFILDNITDIRAHKANKALAGIPIAKKFNKPGFPVDTLDRILVCLRVSSRELVKPKLISMGCQIKTESEKELYTWIPQSLIEDVASLQEVKGITSIGFLKHREVISEGLGILNGDKVKNIFGASGTGVTVGVISNGMEYSQLASNAYELPPYVNYVDNGSSSTLYPGSEGTAMMEIIHDFAPNATIFFGGINGNDGGLDFAARIHALTIANCKVIVDDIGILSGYSFFQEKGIWDEIRRFVDDMGGCYISAAGNNRGMMYVGNSYGISSDTNKFLTYDSQNSQTISFFAHNLDRLDVFLQWAEDWDNPVENYVLYLYDEQCTTLLKTGSKNSSSTGPENYLSYTPSSGLPVNGTYRIKIKWTNFTSTSNKKYIKLLLSPEGGDNDPAITSMIPCAIDNEIYGKEAYKNVISVAAAAASTPTVTENFSSRGPGIIYTFQSNGSTSEITYPPVITGIDGVQTYTGQQAHFSNPFNGTSAAAPHIAGIAAQYFSKYHSNTAAQFKNALISSSIAIDGGSSASWDKKSGYGRADAFSLFLNTLTQLPNQNYTSNATVSNVRFTAMNNTIASGCTLTVAPYTVASLKGGMSLGANAKIDVHGLLIIEQGATFADYDNVIIESDGSIVDYSTGAVPVTLNQVNSSGLSTGSIDYWKAGGWQNIPVLPVTKLMSPGTQTFRATQNIINGEKYNRWNSFPDVTNHQGFSINAQNNTFTAYLKPVSNNIKVKNTIDGVTTLSVGTVTFKDPWKIDDNTDSKGIRNQGSTTPFSVPMTSPLTIGSADGYLGAFLKQSNTVSWPEPYYSVGTMDEGATWNSHPLTFLGWSSNGMATFKDTSNIQTGVIFNNDGAEVYANFKGHLITSNSDELAGAGQQPKTDRNYVVYASAGKIWGSVSGQTELLLSDAAPNEVCRNPVMVARYDPDNSNIINVFVAYEQYNPDLNTTTIMYKKFSTTLAYLYGSSFLVGNGNLNTELTLCTTRTRNYITRTIFTTYIFFRENSTEGLRYIRYIENNGVLSSPYPYSMPVQYTGLNSHHPAVAVTWDGTSTVEYYETVYLVWEEWMSGTRTTSKIYYQNLLAGNHDFKDLTTGTPLYISYNPSITAFTSDPYNPPYVPTARVVWSGKYPWGTVSTVLRNPDNMTQSWQFGSNVKTPSIINTLFVDGGFTYFLGWSQPTSGSNYTNYYVDKTLSAANIKSISGANGSDMQIIPGNSLLTTKAFVLTGSTAPYAFTVSPFQAEPLAKINEVGSSNKSGSDMSKLISSSAVAVDITSKDNAELTFHFALGDISVNDNHIEFITAPDSLQFTSDSLMNKYLQSDAFELTDASKLVYSVSYAPPQDSAIDLFTNGSSLNFKVQLVDAAGSEVLGTFDDVTYNSANTTQHDNILYRVNAAGIRNRKVKLRLIVSNNILTETKYDYVRSAVAESAEEILAKKESKSGNSPYMGFGVLIPLASKEKTVTFKGEEIKSESSTAKIMMYELSQNYPNPFNPTAVINYQIPEAGHVTLGVYDMLGKQVLRLVDEEKTAGAYQVSFNASHLASGVYLYRIECNDFRSVKKMTLIK